MLSTDIRGISFEVLTMPTWLVGQRCGTLVANKFYKNDIELVETLDRIIIKNYALGILRLTQASLKKFITIRQLNP